jgi:hypothetical protein
MSLSKSELLEKAKEVFDIYPASKEFHFSADGQAFSQKADALNHARGLEVKDTVLITKSMAAAGTIDVPSDPAPAAVDPNGAKNEFQKLGVKSEKGLSEGGSDPVKEAEALEMQGLLAKHEALSGKKAAGNIKLETLKAKVQELEADKPAADEAAKVAAAGSGEIKNQNEEK